MFAERDKAFLAVASLTRRMCLPSEFRTFHMSETRVCACGQITFSSTVSEEAVFVL